MQGKPLALIVGLGNPGPQYQANRHNAGAIFVQELARTYQSQLRSESKFFGETTVVSMDGTDIRLLIPTTFMNNSGRAVAAVCNFFKIAPENMLVAYDEIDFDVGVTRFKFGGGHGGHNGMRDIISTLGGFSDFYRLRIGVGHPGHKSMVSNHVLSNPSVSEQALITADISDAIRALPKAVKGEWEEAMRLLHSN